MDFIKNSVLVLCLFFLIGCLRFSSQNELAAFDLSRITIDKQTHPVVILGGGVGGLTAATYLAQANIKTLLIEGTSPGGAIAQSDSVRNWPGEIDIPGKKLADKVRKQTIENGVKITQEEVLDVDFSVWPYLITTKKTDTGQTRTIKTLSCIIAMGATPNYLKVPGEEKYWGSGVSNCAICDGSLYKDKIVAVVGGGNAAITEASYLSKIAKEVFVLVRNKKLRVSGKFVDEIIAKNNVKILYNTKIKEIVGDDKKLKQLIITKNNDEQKLEIDGLFLAIGSKPNTQIFENQIELDSNGYIVLKDYQQTSKYGIFSLGDISDPKFRQAITAAGDGCKAALQTHGFLEKIGFEPSMLKEKTEKEVVEEKIDIKVIEIANEQEFEKQVLKSDLPVVVDFYADWCFPCKKMAPIFEKIAQSFAGKIKFVKVNVTNNNELARKMGIQSVPTFILIKDGAVIKRVVGGKDFEGFKKIITDAFQD